MSKDDDDPLAFLRGFDKPADETGEDSEDFELELTQEDGIEEVVDEGYSANYPEDGEDFSLAGDDQEANWDDNYDDDLKEENMDRSWDKEDPAPPQEKSTWESSEPSLPPLQEPANLENEPAWTEDPEEVEEWLAEEDVDDAEGAGAGWPLGLIAVAVVALLLLAAGGYGVMQQRAAAEEELRELRAALGTSISPEEANRIRKEQSQLTAENTSLQQNLKQLETENRQLKDSVAGLEAQLSVQREAVKQALAEASAVAEAAKAAAAKAQATPKPAAKPTAAAPARTVQATPKPPVSQPAATVSPSAGGWFVNFSSYNQRTIAEIWQEKLKPDSGNVVIQTARRNGSTLYRLRVIGLSDRDAAERVARQLEKDHGVPKLWVGQQ